MDTLETHSWWNCSTINDQVSDLAHEQVGRDPPRLAILVAVRTRIYKSKSLETRRSLENRQASRVSDELSHVVEDDRFGD